MNQEPFWTLCAPAEGAFFARQVPAGAEARLPYVHVKHFGRYETEAQAQAACDRVNRVYLATTRARLELMEALDVLAYREKAMLEHAATGQGVMLNVTSDEALEAGKLAVEERLK